MKSDNWNRRRAPIHQADCNVDLVLPPVCEAVRSKEALPSGGA